MEDKTVLDKIYEKFEKLKKEATEDVKFDKADFDNAFDNTNKLMKYIKIRSEWSRVQREFERKRKEQYKVCFEYYQTEYPLKLNNREEYLMFIESDPRYFEPYTHVQTVKEVLIFIDSTIDTLKSRGFEIKHALEYEKFKNGL